MESPRFQHLKVEDSDRALYPLVAPGATLVVDTEMTTIPEWVSPRSEFDLPIFVLNTPQGRRCFWCRADSSGTGLTLMSHPLSGEPVKELLCPEEAQVIGQVVAMMTVFERRAGDFQITHAY